MVDESLKRLLDAEAEAEVVIARADEQRHTIIEQARHDVHEAETRHAERVAGIHASFLAQAEQRAQQTILELKRRHAEKSAALQATAEQHREDAIATALALLTRRKDEQP